MIKMPYEQIIEKVVSASGNTKEQIEEKITKKMDQLSGLISKEGAAHIIANELGVKLFEVKEKAKIKELLEGMRDLTITGKVQQVYEVREFSTEKRSGKVGTFLMGDETGVIRVVLWNDQADILAKLAPDMIIKITNTFVKNNQNRLELHLNDRSSLLLNPDGVTVGEVAPAAQQKESRKKINALQENDRQVSIVGTVVQVFDPRFFEVCPECNKRAKPQDGAFVCATHNVVTPKHNYVMNLFADDGSDNIRIVCFGNVAAELLGKQQPEMDILRENPEGFVQLKTDLLGTIVRFTGRVVRNKMFDRLEFIADAVDKNVDPEQEIKRLNEEIQKAESEIPTDVPH